MARGSRLARMTLVAAAAGAGPVYEWVTLLVTCQDGNSRVGFTLGDRLANRLSELIGVSPVIQAFSRQLRSKENGPGEGPSILHIVFLHHLLVVHHPHFVMHLSLIHI